MVLVVYSLTSFAFRLIFFAFASTFAWCEPALDLLWFVPAGGVPAAGLRLGSEMVGGGDTLVLHGLLHVAPLGEQAAGGAGLRELLLVVPVALPHHVRENHRGVLRHPAVDRVTVHVLALRVWYTCNKTFHNVIQTSCFKFYSNKVPANQFLKGFKVHSHLRFIRDELLSDLFSPHNYEKWVHKPLLYFSVHAKVDQIAII